MWKVSGTKNERTRARYIFLVCVHGNSRKSDFQVDSISPRGVTLILNGLFTPQQMSKRGSTSAGRKDPLGKVSKKTEFIWDFVPNYG